MTQPLVSVCVPTYNRTAFLRQSLPTILAQTYEPLEILICDNGSTDETEAMCRAAQANDARVRYLRYPTNIGLYQNHNVAIRESRGEFLCFFHDDDLYEPTIVAEYAAFLQTHPEVGLVCSDWELIDDDGKPIGIRRFGGPAVVSGQAYVEQTIRSGRSSLNCPGTMIRRAALRDIRFDEAGPIGFGDFVVWFHVAETSAVGHISRQLWHYRIHRGSLSRRTVLSMTQDYRTALRRYCADYGRRWPAHQARVARWEIAIDRFLFWSLVYEVGRHYRRQHSLPPTPDTIFDVMGYTLSPDELKEALGMLKGYQHGLVKPCIRRLIELFVSSGHEQPLGWMTRWAPRLREALNR